MIYKKAYFELLGSISDIIEKLENSPSFATNELIINTVLQLKNASRKVEEIVVSDTNNEVIIWDLAK